MLPYLPNTPGPSRYSIVRFAIARLGTAALTVLASSPIVFAATQIMPGDAATLILGTYATPDALETLRQKLGLHDPAWLQYLHWLSGVATGDFGESFRMNTPVGPLLLERLLLSGVLAGGAIVLVSLFGIGLGTAAALLQNRPADRAISALSMLGISVPEFVTGSVLILAFAGLLPSSGYAPLTDGLGSWIAHLLLPIASLTLILLAHVTRTARVSMIETLGAAYIRTAVLKGLPTWIVVLKHALRNALLPTITVIGINVGYLIGGIVIVESVFAYPGLGRLTVFAVQQRDVPVIQACTLTIAAIYAFTSLITDLLYFLLNPRLRPH